MRKSRRRLGVAIDMTPMVDVAFLLLIFFMTTTTFKPPDEVVIDLPASHSEYKVPDSDVLILTVSKDSEIYSQLGTHDMMRKVAPGEVGPLIRTERTKNSRLRFIVRADKNSNYGTMEDLINTLQEARATRFVLMTEGESGQQGDKALPAGDEGTAAPSKGDGTELGSLLGGAGGGEVALASLAGDRPSKGGPAWAR